MRTFLRRCSDCWRIRVTLYVLAGSGKVICHSCVVARMDRWMAIAEPAEDRVAL